MKNLLLTFLILLFPQAYGFENYVIISNSPVESLIWDNDEILSASPLITVDDKNTIILTPKHAGKTNLSIGTENGTKIIISCRSIANIIEDKTIISNMEGLTYFPLDLPQTPPQLREGN